MRRVLLRIVDIAVRFIFVCTLVAILVSFAAFIYLRIARVPVREIDSEIPVWYTPQHPQGSHVPVTPAFRKAAQRAQLDHLADPVPELSHRSRFRFVSCGDPISVPPDFLFIQCYPSITDCAVLYRCTPDGKLLWKSFDNRSP